MGKENKEKQKNGKHTGKKRGGLFPKRPLYVIILLILGLISAALMIAMIMVNTFPPDLTMLVIGTMAGLFLVTSFMMARDKRWKRLVGIVLAAVFAVVFGSATYFMGSSYAMMNNISEDSEFTNAGGVRASGIDPTTEAFNVYLTGIDQWEAEKGLDLERSDVNMIITVNPVTKKVLLTSIPRDSYVKLHTAQQMDKLTHTGIYGVDETLNTVEDWLGVDLKYYVKMNFSGARDIINAIGGIKVYSPVAFDSSLAGYHYEKGWNALSGREALFFARERHAFEGQDSIRVENQQRVVQAIIKRMTSSPALLTHYGEVMHAAENNLHTNMSYSEIRDIVKMQMSDLATWDIQSQKIEGEYDEDYVASLTQAQKFQIYRPSEESVNACIKRIEGIMQPSDEELAQAAAERRKGFILNVLQKLLSGKE